MLFLFILNHTAWGQQKETGIYFTVKCNRHVPSQTVLLTSKSVCLTGNPIIISADFESVSEVRTVNDEVHFDLKLTSKGYNRLLKIQTSFPNSELAFVVEGDVFIIYDTSKSKVQTILRIQRPSNNIELFILLQSKLEKLLTETNQK